MKSGSSLRAVSATDRVDRRLAEHCRSSSSSSSSTSWPVSQALDATDVQQAGARLEGAGILAARLIGHVVACLVRPTRGAGATHVTDGVGTSVEKSPVWRMPGSIVSISSATTRSGPRRTVGHVLGQGAGRMAGHLAGVDVPARELPRLGRAGFCARPLQVAAVVVVAARQRKDNSCELTGMWSSSSPCSPSCTCTRCDSAQR